VKGDAPLPLKKARYAVEILSKPQPPTKSRPPVAQKSVSPAPSSLPAKQTTELPAAQAALPLRKTANHHEKVVNGIKHELDRLNPAKADIQKVDEKRSLRSAEGTKFKSDLSLYFPDYDEVIGNVPKEERMFLICETDRL
jgi:hypothetical protein